LCLCRAQKLIAGLGGEKSRWTAAAERLGQEYVQLTGDVLLAAAQIAYLGAFTSTYRTECLRQWVRMCAAKGVPCSEKFKLAAVLADPVKVRSGLVQAVRVRRAVGLARVMLSMRKGLIWAGLSRVRLLLAAGSPMEHLGAAKG
jgi:hypothetical protein